MRVYLTFFCLCTLPLNGYASDEEGLYIGSKVGWSYFAHGCEAHETSCDRDAIGAGVLLGYQFNNWLSLEGGYDYFGKAKAVYPALDNSLIDAPYEADVQGVELGLKADYSISSAWNLFGKVGALGWKADKTGQEIGSLVEESDDGVSLMLGAGIEYQISQALSARLEYQWFDNVGDNDTGGSDVNFTTLGLTYKFGKDSAQPPVITAVAKKTETKTPSKPVMITIKAQDGSSLFEFDSSVLTPFAKTQLVPILEHLNRYPDVRVKITGHTDSLGAEDYNLKLSQSRAEAVKRYLESEGVSASHIVAEGVGERFPVSTNSTAEGRAQNRRVEIHTMESVVQQTEEQ
ncbi:OmpA family protein [Vibrio sp. TRT 21S02]|uniref:OmpA family protein n=1 Tax=Vibrio sp. TRT 21S02 TaxID=3418507 RepID=UPI003CECAD6F